MSGTRKFISTATVAAALCLPGTAAAADFPLSAYWPLNEGKGQVVRDWSGNGNHGQLGSTPGVDANDPSWIKGLFFWSYGLRFDGGDFVSIPDSNSLEPQQMTVSAWFRGNGSPGKLQVPGREGLEPVRDRVLRPLHGQRRRHGLLRRRRAGLRLHPAPPRHPRASGTASGTTPRGPTTAASSACSSTARRSAPGPRAARRSSTASRAATRISAATSAAATSRSPATWTRCRSGPRRSRSATSGSARRCSSLRTEAR